MNKYNRKDYFFKKMDTTFQINSVMRYLNVKKIKNTIIVIAVLIIAFQALYFIHLFGVDVPAYDEWAFVGFAEDIHNGEPFWHDQHFLQHNEHRPIFPSLIFAVNVILFSWNSVYMMYFGWTLLVVSIYIFYLLLKKTNPALTWLLVAIAAFQFSTAGYDILLWGLPSTAWFLTSIGFVLSIYFLDKTRESTIAIVPAIIFGIMASFSEINGLIVWLAGAVSLFYFKNTRKIPILCWLLSAVIITLLYFTNYNFSTHKGIQISTLFTTKGVVYVLTYLTNGLGISDDGLRLMAGIFILAIIIGGPIYLKTQKQKIDRLIPWIQFGLIGLFSALITELGRFGIETSLAPRYLIMATFSQISALVIGTFVFVYIYRQLINRGKKISILSIYSISIILLITLLGVSYHSGWNTGQVVYYERLEALQCLTNPNSNYACPFLYPSLDYLVSQAKSLQESHLGPFKTEHNLTLTNHDTLLENENWQKMTSDLQGDGYVDHIGTDLTSPVHQINFTKSSGMIQVDGWAFFHNNNLQVDSIYAFIDNKTNSKLIYGLQRQDVAKAYGHETTAYSGWEGLVSIYNLSKGCHNFSVRIVNGYHYYVITTPSQICIN